VLDLLTDVVVVLEAVVEVFLDEELVLLGDVLDELLLDFLLLVDSVEVDDVGMVWPATGSGTVGLAQLLTVVKVEYLRGMHCATIAPPGDPIITQAYPGEQGLCAPHWPGAH
jgi:hypothetical protein